MARSTTYISVQLGLHEKNRLDEAARQAGMNRNKFIRSWIASLPAVKASGVRKDSRG